MRWRGETWAQWLARVEQPHRSFAWRPRQMECGSWVWLEWHWARRVPTWFPGDSLWRFGLARQDVAARPAPPPAPPPAKK